MAITGATGLVGSRVLDLLTPDFRFHPLGRDNGFDLEALGKDRQAVRIPDVDALLHLAARTDVDGLEAERAQGEQGKGWRINVEATRVLASAAADSGIRLILASTDFVFPVGAQGPFGEHAAPAAAPAETSWYGWTKRVAEGAVAEASPAHAIVRIAYPYRGPFPKKTDHARRVLQLYDEGRLYPMFTDQVFTPSFVDDVALGLAEILTRRLADLFHLVSRDLSTPFEFARRLLQATGRDPSQVRPGRFEDLVQPHRAPRPKLGGLSAEATRARGLSCRPTPEAISQLARQLGPPPKPGKRTVT